MTFSIRRATEPTDTDDQPPEVRALARIIAFARENAVDMDLDIVAHHLDLALRSVLGDADDRSDGPTHRETDRKQRRAH